MLHPLHSPTGHFANGAATAEVYTLSLHDALPISPSWVRKRLPRIFLTSAKRRCPSSTNPASSTSAPKRSEEHTSELQSRGHLVCRLLLEKKQSGRPRRRTRTGRRASTDPAEPTRR